MMGTRPTLAQEGASDAAALATRARFASFREIRLSNHPHRRNSDLLRRPDTPNVASAAAFSTRPDATSLSEMKTIWLDILGPF